MCFVLFLRLVILGGDGSFLEVLNCLLTRAQKEAGLDYDQPTCKLKPLEIPIGIIPTGWIGLNYQFSRTCH